MTMSNKDIIRMAISSGSLNWSDAVSISRNLTAPDIYTNKVDSGSGTPAASSIYDVYKKKKEEEEKGEDLKTADSNEVTTEPTEARKSVAENNYDSIPSQDEIESYYSNLMPVAKNRRKTIFKDSYTPLDFVADSWYSTWQQNLSTKIEREYGKRSFLYGPAISAAEGLRNASADPDLYLYSNFTKEKQGDLWFEKDNFNMLMTPEQEAEYNRLKRQEDLAYRNKIDAESGFPHGFTVENTMGPDYDKIKGQADLYRERLRNRGLITRGERRQEYESSLEKERIINSYNNTIGMAMKAPLGYLSDPGSLIGDVASMIVPGQNLIPDGSNRRDRWVERAYQSKDYDFKDRLKNTFSLSNIGEASEMAAKGLAWSAPFSLGYSTAASLGAGLSAGLGAGAIALNQSVATTGASKYRILNDAEIPDELVNAHAKYAHILEYLGRKEKYDKYLPTIDDLANGKNWDIEHPGWYDELMKEVESDFMKSEEKVQKYRDAKDNLSLPSKEFQAKADAGKTLYQVPGNVGASMTEAGTMLANTALTSLIFAGTSMIAKTPFGVNIPNIYLPATVISTATNAYTSVLSRETEAFSQFADSYNQKFDNALRSSGIELNNITDAQLMDMISVGETAKMSTDGISGQFIKNSQYTSLFFDALNEINTNGYLSEQTRGTLTNAIRSGILKTKIPEVEEARAYAENQSREILNQFMALGLPDMYDGLIASLPFNAKGILNTVRSGRNSLVKGGVMLADDLIYTSKKGGQIAAKSILKSNNSITDNMVYMVDDLTEYMMKSKVLKSTGKFMANTKTGKVISFLSKGAASNIPQAFQETFLEEIPQDVISKKYINDSLKENQSFIESAADAYSNALTGGKALLGISPDPLYDDNNDLVEVAKMSAILSMILPSAISAVSGQSVIQGYNAIANARARKFVESNVVSVLSDKNRMAKSDVYVNNRSSFGKDRIIQYLHELKKNLPEGITAEDIDAEIKVALETFSVADSKAVKNYAKKTGGIGSQDHKQLTGLIMTHRQRANQANSEATDLARSASSELMAEYGRGIQSLSDENQTPSVSHFEAYLRDFNEGREIPLTEEQMMAIHASKVALEALDMISFNDPYDSRFSRTKVGIMNSRKRTMEIVERAKFLSMLNSNGLLSEEKYNELLKDKGSISELIDNALSESNLMIESSPGLNNTISSISTLIGAHYDSKMANNLMGRLSDRKLTEDEHTKFVDAHLEAYRSREKAEVEHQELLEEIDQIKNEVVEEKSIPDTPVEPIVFNDIVEPINATEEAKEEIEPAAVESTDESLDSVESVEPKNETEDIAGNAEQDQPIDNDSDSYDELSKDELDAIELGRRLAERSAAENNETEENANENTEEIEDEVIDESSSEPQTSEDKELYSSMENEDSSDFYAILEEHPEAKLLDPASRFDKLSHTLFFTSDSDYSKLSAFLMDPGAFDGDVSIRVAVDVVPLAAWTKHRPGERYMPFSLRDNSTYDNALISIIVKKGNDTHKFMLSMPDNAIKAKKTIRDSSDPSKTITINKFTPEEIAALRQFRSRVISEYIDVIDHGGSKVLKVVGGIFRGKAKISVNKNSDGASIQRPLHKIKGLIDGFSGDFSKINSNNVVIGYGKGAKGLNIVAGKDGRLGVTVEQNSGSAILIKTNPLSGNPEMIKINKLRIGKNKGLSNLIYKLVVEHGASGSDSVMLNDKGELIKTPPGVISNLGMSSSYLLSTIVRFGDGTIVEPSKKSELSHLLPKQFYIKNGITLVYGENELSIADPSKISETDKVNLLRYIEDNFTWSVDKDKLWDPNGNDNKVSTIFPSISKHFKESSDPIKIADGMVLTKEDMDLTWLGWLVKNGKLIADLKDGVFDAPYAFINDVVSVEKSNSPVIDNQYSAPVVEDKPVITEENSGKDTTGDGESFPDINDDWIPQAPRTASNPNAEQLPSDIEDEVSWLASRLGVSDGDGLRIIEDLIELADGTSAMGVLREYSIILSKLSEKGTAYHEAFHKISLLVLPRKVRMKIYNQVRETVESLRTASNSKIEEYLAENFRDYVLTNDLSSQPSSIKIGFRRIGNLIKSISGFKYKDINRLYSDINAGLFRRASQDKKSVDEFKERYGDWKKAYEPEKRTFAPQVPRRISDLGMTAIKDATIFYDIVDGLSYFLMRLNGINSTENVGVIDYSKLQSFIAKTIPKLDGVSKEIWFDIRDNFDNVFRPEIDAKLRKMGLYEQEDLAGEEDDSVVSREKIIYDRASYAMSKSNNIGTEVKFFMSTIADSVVTENGAVPIRDNVTKMYKFVPFSSSWNRMMNDLHAESTPSGMISKIGRLADVTQDGFYKMLRAKLAEVDDNFITKLWTTLYSHKHQFVNFGYNPNAVEENDDYSISIEDSYIDRATRVLPLEWSENLSGNGFLYDDTNEGLVFNKKNALYIREEYNKLFNRASAFLSGRDKSMTVKDANDMLSDFISLFNRIGISIDSETMNYIIGSGIMGKENRIKSICNLISDSSKNSNPAFIFSNIVNILIDNNGSLSAKSGKKKPIKSMLVGEKSCQALASAYAYVHPSPNEVMALGADNNNYYAISERNYLTNIIDKIKSDAGFLNLMLNIPYNKHSIILNQIKNKNGKSIMLKTFIKFYEKSSSDAGKDYKSLSKIEDYVVKMAISLSGRIAPSPTFADKGSYYFIDGLYLPKYHGSNNSVRYAVKNGNTYINFPEDTLDIMDGYFSDEFEAIKAAWNDVLDAKGDKRLLQSNYHFGGVNSRTGKKHKFDHGNGLRFRNLDMITINNNGVAELVNLNDLMEGLLDLHGEVDGMNAFIEFMNNNYFNKKRLDRLTHINNTLSSALRAEIDWAIDAGIIERSLSGKLINKFIDNAIFDKTTKELGINVNDYELTSEIAVINLIANNMVNGIIGNIEFEKVISKDSAFYKNQDDRIKRLGSLISTGKDLRTEFPIGHELHGKNSFNIAHVSDNIMKSSEIASIKERVLYSVVNSLIKQSTGRHINNLHEIATNPNSSELFESIKHEHSKAFEEAEKIAEKIVEGYGEVDETDGTAWISPSMYRSILIRSKGWNDKMQEAFDMIEGEDTSWMSDPQKYAIAMGFMMQPLKMIYFGDDIKRNLNTPRLNKMAMFCVFRPIATGDLKHLYDAMNNKDKPIDMIAVSQAAKIGLKNPQKLYKDEYNTELNDLSTLDVFQQKFEYLRHQLETEPHDGDKTALRTQVQKVAMSNIDKNRVYQNITIGGKKGATGAQLIAEWASAINELSNRGKSKVEAEFGLTIDPTTGNYNVDIKKLYAFLQKEAINSNMPTSTIEMLGEFDSNNPKEVPLQAMLNDLWIESKILSFIMRKTIDVDTPGGMFIQMSAFGMKISDDRLASEYTLNGGEKLNFLNSDGSMDAVVSIKLFNDIIPAKIRNNYKKSRNWLIENNIIGEFAGPIAMSYRIPTQGMSSVHALRIKDVMIDTIGETIILPSEFTKLTGSDFDIDKLFIARHNYSGTHKVEMNDSFEDKWKRNSSAAIQNRLLDIMMASVTDPNSAAEARMPIDLITNDLKNNVLADIDKITAEDKKESPFKFARPSFNTDKKVEFTISKNGIGPIALANANHPLTQMTGLSFIDADILTRFNMTRLDKVTGKDGIRILDWLSALINAHVDVAKDPYIIRLGINQHTYKAATFMLRTGAGRSTFYFLSQPIMREFYSVMDRYVGTYGNLEGDSRVEANAEKLIKKYKETALKLAEAETDKQKSTEMKSKLSKMDHTDENGRKTLDGNQFAFDVNSLRGILKKEETFDWYYRQAMIMETFLALAPFYNALSNLVKYSQVDTKKAGKSFSEQREYAKQLNAIAAKDRSDKSIFVGLSDYLNNTYISTKMDNSIGLAQRMFHGILFRTTESVQAVGDKIISLIGRDGYDNSELSKTIHRYIDSKIKSKFFLGLADSNSVNISDLFFGHNTMAKRLHSIKSEMSPGGAYERLIGNSFFENISYSIFSANQNETPDHITVKTNSTADSYYADRIQQYFSDALSDGDPLISSFARDFILYQFFSTGDNPALNTLKISEEDRYDIGFYRFIKNELDLAASSAEQYLSDEDISDIFRNRWYDNSLVPIKETSKEVFDYSSNQIGRSNFPSLMSLEGQTITGSRYPLMFVDMMPTRTFKSNEIELFAPFVKTKVKNTSTNGTTFILHRLVGTTRIGDKTYPVYFATNKLGTKSKGLSVIEHGLEKSMIDSNNLPKTFSGDNIDFEEWSRHKLTKGLIEGPLKEFKPIDRMTTFGQHFSIEPMQIGSEMENVINTEINKAIETGDYSISNIDSAIGNIPFIDEQAINEARIAYANGILSRSDELLANALMSGRAIDEDALESLEMRLKEYLGEYYQVSEDTDSNYTENADTDRGNPSEYTNHSGGAVGADSMWDSIGREFGVVNHRHYYHGNKTPLGNQLISETDFNEGVDAMNRASGILNRKPAKQSTIDLLARNWSQVKYSTQINAIAPIADDFKSVSGGTGWAVAMAQSDSVKREINVFNLNDNKWYKWNGSIFELSDIPTLHKNFAGIGSRQDYGTMSQESIDAIRDVYSNTFTATEKGTINVYAGANENADLSNFAIRPFYDQEAETQFQSVEQAFHWYKAMSVGATDTSDMVMKTTNGGELRKLTDKGNLRMSPDQAAAWDSRSSSIMKSLIRMSFEQNKDAADRLIGTGNSTITHIQDNSKWKTEFPRILMEVRDELAEKSRKNESRTGLYDAGATSLETRLREYLNEYLAEESIDNAESERTEQVQLTESDSSEIVTAEYSFDTERDASYGVEDNNIKSGTVISISGNLFVVKNEENEDIEFTPIADKISNVYNEDNTSITSAAEEEELTESIKAYKWHGSTYTFVFSGDAISDAWYTDGKGERHEFSKNKNLEELYNNILLSGNYEEILETTDDGTTSVLADSVEDSDMGDVDFSKLGISFELNDGQKDAIRLITDWIDSKSIEPFVLKGSAGTGKTTIMKAVIGYIESINKNRGGANKIQIALASPTNSQKRVLSDITGKKATTIHTLLGMRPNMNIDDFVLGQEDKFTDPKGKSMPRNGLLIVDECSMIKDDLADFIIMEASNKGTMVLFLGDPKQLDPVNNIDTENNRNKKSKTLDYDNAYELTEVMRVRGDNPLMTIVDYASKVMSPVNKNIDVVRRTIHNGSSGAVFLSESAHEYLIKESVERYFNTEEYENNPHYAKWMTYTNKDAIDINTAIRSLLGYNEVVEEGEQLVGRKKRLDNAGDPIIENGDYYKVVSVNKEEKLIKSRSVPGVEIPVIEIEIQSMVDSNSSSEFLNVLNSNDQTLLNQMSQAISKRESEIASADVDRRTKASMWREFRESLDNDFVSLYDIVDSEGSYRRTLKKAELGYYYAITTHTSQGKEFDNVFIHDTNLRLKLTDAPIGEQGQVADEYKKLFYVAISRAKQNAFVSTNGNRFNEIAPGSWAKSNPGQFDTLSNEKTDTENVFDKINKLGRQSDKC